jgi:excinuclease ABC subunit A
MTTFTDGEIVDVNEVPELDKNKNHTIEVVVDRLVVKEGIETSSSAVSIESASLVSMPSLTTNRSTTTSIV